MGNGPGKYVYSYSYHIVWAIFIVKYISEARSWSADFLSPEGKKRVEKYWGLVDQNHYY